MNEYQFAYAVVTAAAAAANTAIWQHQYNNDGAFDVLPVGWLIFASWLNTASHTWSVTDSKGFNFIDKYS